jgi:hypothetical protein
MSKTPKRPRDTNQLAKLMVDILTGEVEDKKPVVLSEAHRFAQAGGLKGGAARAKKLSPEIGFSLPVTVTRHIWRRSRVLSAPTWTMRN